MATELIICDTDVLIDYLDDAKIRHKSVKDILENSISLNNVVLSSITKMELFLGADNKRELNLIDKSLKRFGALMLNQEISEKSIELIKKYNLSHGLLIPDSLIAATAIITDLPLFTYNLRDFKFIKGLKLFQ